MSTPTLFRSRTPLHHWHESHGARWTENNGWQLPAVYSSVEQEVAAAQTAVAIADVSAFAKLSLQGPGVAGLAQAISPNTAAVKLHGVAILSDRGPLLACRLTDGHLLLLASRANDAAIRDRIPNESEGVVQNDVTSTYAEFLLIGPRIEGVLRRLSGFDVAVLSFPVGTCAETSLAGTHAILVRSPELALPSARVLIAWDLAEFVWQTIFHAGRQLGIVPLGMNALDALRGSTRPG